MHFRSLVFWFATACLALAQPAFLPEELRTLLNNPQNAADASRLAKQLMGEHGCDQFFYFPTHDEPATPAKWGFKYENVSFKSTDGTPLHGWFIRAKSRQPKGTVVFSHGNAGSMGYHLGFVMWLAESGYNLFMYDYRGFGKSGGEVSRRGLVSDVKAAFTYVKSRKDIDTNRLISFGHSLGGAKSVTALAESPVKGVRAIVTDGAFASYRRMAKVFCGEVGANLVDDDLAPKDYAAKLNVPLLVIHGVQDEVVPFSEGKQLFAAAHQPKTFFEVKDGHHGDSLSRNGGAYRKRMLAWLAEVK